MIDRFLADPKVRDWLKRYPPKPQTQATFAQGVWTVNVWSGKAGEVATGSVDDQTGAVTEAWTGPQVAWRMARGYAGAFECPEDMSVGVAAIGYGDGYPRHAGSGTPVLVGGERASLIGRVSMDLVTIDLRNAPDAKVGDAVVLWGRGLPVEEIADHAGTIAYELTCGVTRRVRFVEDES